VTLFPYTTLFRSMNRHALVLVHMVGVVVAVACGAGGASGSRAEGAEPLPRGTAGVQTQPGADPAGTSIQRFNDLFGTAQKRIGSWDDYAVAYRAAVERSWQQHGTGSESDRFARELAIQMSKIPVWTPLARVDKAVSLMQQRYEMTDEQATRLKQVILRGTLQVVVRHADDLLSLGQEIIAVGGLTGDASDAERVARWAKIIKPIRADALAYMERETPQVIAMLDAAHQQQAREDVATLQRWQAHRGALLDKWIAGKWQYEDVGLSHEMFDSRWLEAEKQRQTQVDAAPSPPLPRQPGGAVAHEPPDPWTAYVQAFVLRHALDAAQRQTAYAILNELQQRATGYMLAHRPDLQELDRRVSQASVEDRSAAQRDRDAMMRPVDLMFQELKDRLEPLPTTAQRTAASQPTVTTRTAPTSAPAGRPVAAVHTN
jgi:hypothetical protein